MFELALENHCTEGLELFPAVVDVPPGASKTIRIPVQNSSNNDVYLLQRVVLGCIQPILVAKPLILHSTVQRQFSQTKDSLVCATQLSTTDSDHQSMRTAPEKRNGTHLSILNISVKMSRSW